MEMFYAADYPFVEYGIDLEHMARLEAGVPKISRILRKHTDTGRKATYLDPARQKAREERKKEMGVWYAEKLSELPRRVHDKIPIDFVGFSDRGYLLYDVV